MSTNSNVKPARPSLRDYARAARRAAVAVPGVARVGGRALTWLVGAVPGVRARREERDRLYLEIDVVAKLGEPLHALGVAVQASVQCAVREMPGLRPVAIDIIITGIRIDKRGLPKR